VQDLEKNVLSSDVDRVVGLLSQIGPLAIRFSRFPCHTCPLAETALKIQGVEKPVCSEEAFQSGKKRMLARLSEKQQRD